MPAANTVLTFLLVMGLLLAAALCGLAASGHFPAEHRAPTLKSGGGPVILFGSLAVAAVCSLAGLVLICLALPWYAIVIGSGGVLFLAPLVLRPFSDTFINGRSALLTFAGVSAVLVILLLMTYGWHVG